MTPFSVFTRSCHWIQRILSVLYLQAYTSWSFPAPSPNCRNRSSFLWRLENWERCSECCYCPSQTHHCAPFSAPAKSKIYPPSVRKFAAQSSQFFEALGTPCSSSCWIFFLCNKTERKNTTDKFVLTLRSPGPFWWRLRWCWCCLWHWFPRLPQCHAELRSAELAAALLPAGLPDLSCSLFEIKIWLSIFSRAGDQFVSLCPSVTRWEARPPSNRTLALESAHVGWQLEEVTSISPNWGPRVHTRVCQFGPRTSISIISIFISFNWAHGLA